MLEELKKEIEKSKQLRECLRIKYGDTVEGVKHTDEVNVIVGRLLDIHKELSEENIFVSDLEMAIRYLSRFIKTIKD
jgi:hypothetical protein